MAEVSNLETINSALKALSLVRATVSDVFRYLSDPPSTITSGCEEESKDFSDLKTFSNNLNARVRYILLLVHNFVLFSVFILIYVFISILYFFFFI